MHYTYKVYKSMRMNSKLKARSIDTGVIVKLDKDNRLIKESGELYNPKTTERWVFINE